MLHRRLSDTCALKSGSCCLRSQRGRDDTSVRARDGDQPEEGEGEPEGKRVALPQGTLFPRGIMQV